MTDKDKLGELTIEQLLDDLEYLPIASVTEAIREEILRRFQDLTPATPVEESLVAEGILDRQDAAEQAEHDDRTDRVAEQGRLGVDGS